MILGHLHLPRFLSKETAAFSKSLACHKSRPERVEDDPYLLCPLTHAVLPLIRREGKSHLCTPGEFAMEPQGRDLSLNICYRSGLL